MSNIQWVVVDDADPRILYSGSWFTEGEDTLNDMGQFGAPFLLTSHGTTSNSSITFSFSGTQLVVAGSQLVPSDPNSFAGTCTVDGVIQTIVYTNNNATNRVALCRYQDLSDNSHTLVLDAVPAGKKTFWFDYLRYLPTPDVPTVNEYVEVLTDNHNLFFDSSWSAGTPEGVSQISTNILNSKMSYTFVGTSITWYGSYNQSTSLHRANLSYTIDQQEPLIVEILPSTKARDNITMEQVIFNATGLSPGIAHDLNVTYLGSQQSVPLSLNNFIITWGPLPGLGPNSSEATQSHSGISSPPSQTINPSNTPSASNHKSARIFRIAMAASIVGAAIVVGFIVLFVVSRRRRQRAPAPKAVEMAQDSSPRPFVVPSNPNVSRKQTDQRATQPAAVVPTSKARIRRPEAGIVQLISPPIAVTEAAGPSISTLNPSPTDREAATYLWNLLLRHQRGLSAQPTQHHGDSVGPENISRDDGNNSMQPPAYEM